MLFLVFTLITMNMFLVVFSWMKKRHENSFACYATSVAAALIYAINPWIVNESIHWFFMWNYAFIPLIFYFTLKGVNRESWKTAARCGMMLGFILILIGTAQGIVYNLLFIFMSILLSILFSKSRRLFLQNALNSLVLLLTLATFSSLLAAYWLLPYIFYFSSYIFQGQTWAIFTAKDIISISQYEVGGLLNVIRLYYPWTEKFLANPLPTAFSPIITFLSLSVLITAVSAILLKKRNKTVLVLSTLAFLFMFLANGSEKPLGDLYLWLALEAPVISSLGWVLFKNPYAYLGYLGFSYAFLCGITISKGSTIISRAILIKGKLPITPKIPIKKSTLVSLILLTVMILPALLNGNPLLSGDLNGYYSPISLPSAYQEANEWLSSKEGDFRVAWLPPSSNVFWSPYSKLPPIRNRDEISPLPLWASSKPVLSLGVTYLLPTHARIFPQYYTYDALSNDKTLSAGKLYGLANVKYIIYHNDVIESTYKKIYENLLKQQDLKLVFNKDYLDILANEHSSPYVYATNGVILVIGGLDVLTPLCNIHSYVPYEHPTVFLEQYPMPDNDIDTLLNFGNIILFYGDKDLNDLTLSSIDDEYLFAPSDHLVETLPLSPWDKDFFYSHLWVPAHLEKFKGAKYDFDLNKKIIFSTEPAEFSFWIRTQETNQHDIWIRTLPNPRGGNISILIDDKMVDELTTHSSILRGFKWIKNGEAHLTKGDHKITIRNNAGFNVINLVAVVPSEKIEEHKISLLNRIVNSNIRLSYLTEGALLDEYRDLTVKGAAKLMKIFPVKSSSYMMAIKVTRIVDHGRLMINVNDRSFVSDYDNASDSEYRYIGPINLTQDPQKIILVPTNVKIDDVFVYEISEKDSKTPTLDEIFKGEMLPFIVNYNRVNPAEIIATVNASKPFILSFAEGYHIFWNANFPKVPLNSIINGFLINKTGCYTVRIEFGPEKYFRLGIALSSLSLVLIVFCYILLDEKLKNALTRQKNAQRSV